LLVLFIGLHALFYAAENLANLEHAHGALSYVLSGADHEAYPNTPFFFVTNTTLHWIALSLVIICEIAIGVFGIKGAWDMFRTKNADSATFHAAKSGGLWAAGLALFLWFGFFMTFGASFFLMWQTELGTGSMEGAFMYAIASAITMMFVYLTED
jgi:predicted small integral membrane protein